jgi:hypothetical protein
LRSFSGRASVIGGMKGFSLRKSPSCADFMEFVDVFFVDEAGQLSLAKFWPVQRLEEASFCWATHSN